MPTDKDFKRVVRTRMQQTGESYTAARAILLQQPPPRRPGAPRAGSVTPPTAGGDVATLAGMSDQAVRAATGCTWDGWVRALDRVDAYTWPHPRIARYIQDTWTLGPWWAQSVTVGYERIKGLRAKGQRRGGGYMANKTRTFPVPVRQLFRAFSDGRTRRRWLEPGAVTVHSSTPTRYVRGRAAAGPGVQFVFTAKGPGRSMVQVQEGPLGTPEDSIRRKAYWEARLDTLGNFLET